MENETEAGEKQQSTTAFEMAMKLQAEVENERAIDTEKKADAEHKYRQQLEAEINAERKQQRTTENESEMYDAYNENREQKQP